MSIEAALFIGFVAGLATAWGMVGLIAPLIVVKRNRSKS